MSGISSDSEPTIRLEKNNMRITKVSFFELAFLDCDSLYKEIEVHKNEDIQKTN